MVSIPTSIISTSHKDVQLKLCVCIPGTIRFVKVRLAPCFIFLSWTSLCDVDTLDVSIETISHIYVLQYCIVLMHHVSSYIKKPLSGELKTPREIW